MSGIQFRTIRESLGLTVAQWAALFAVPAYRIERMEAGREQIAAPLALAAEAIGDGWRPARLRASEPMRAVA